MICILVSSNISNAQAQDLAALKELYKRPLEIPFPSNAVYTPQRATLGKMLFFDPRLSGAKNMNCVSCHNPSFGYEVPVETAVGSANVALKRQAPTVLNAAWVTTMFWDGRAATLEEQAEGPITAPVEMNGKFEDIIGILEEIPEYAEWFAAAFPTKGITKSTILTAIATYERTVVSGWAPFDRWVEGQDRAISQSAIRGFKLFNGKAKCDKCHTGWNFTDNKFHDVGLFGDDLGRGALEPDNSKMQFAFKTPGLRNLSYRAPFMHDGSLPDLDAVMAHYNSGGMERPSRSEHVHPLELNNEELEDLKAFMLSLTAEQTQTPMPTLPN
ncbi:cytochrome-c peroxidase [Polycladidibacter hongkongensis]|uniref:cytochrome-c peroxidase n=1 Tax=Polycladidibacter hongkongensis TaxID=1647556 RepID=UPI00082D2313|nr:cytochrome c peroxidase [Pseudovibrio hongkongensis]